MKAETELRRFIYHTKGVCPPEIHFQLNGGVLEEVRFVGGGCPGNAQMVSRLIKGRAVEEILPLLDGIQCRDKTSCPDQLSVALESALNGTLSPPDPIRIMDDPTPRKKLGLMGALDGNTDLLKKILSGMIARRVDAACCIGNFTGEKKSNKDLIRLLRRQEKMVCIQGGRDWLYANDQENGMSLLKPKDRDWISMLPQLETFWLGERKAVAFYGEYLQDLPGFSDFAPYSLEINMVCGLADFMRDETVFPALEAMIPQFQSDLILFGQRKEWGCWRVGEKDFVSIGRSEESGMAKWGLLEATSNGVRFETIVESD